jgi:hypothetical protein
MILGKYQPTDKVSIHFTYKELLWLPRWSRLANESDGLTDVIMTRLVFMATRMDAVRDYFGAPCNVHCFLRPPAYNSLVGGAENSAHMALVDHLGNPLKPTDMVAAVDFDIVGINCDTARKKIVGNNMLEVWNLRLEKRPGSGWLHLDSAPVITSRYFEA